ncbi:2-succinyl-6-hydroxy-2, 4-cyclohexadiene-1-carboxylate synthase [Methylobacterium crusticola]|uniref:2-succinyl-6-hydroxy-2, 4-cyclohexadiene-1-carboxylate synthase n=1 Tax=Methylobacterium crusticola TaxID=1697972 RepID=A0ABQ4QS87_9HYPH|nr:alpha/beta hydrolase [Methylobacterium crusticola]GJD48163.1 2-succinyl-6-hydroxy-2, 4-cyclohexadiene-1-carboxylate synthase [Methylobacterium crusticola]
MNDESARSPATLMPVGTGPGARRLATLVRPGAGPPVVWLGGFRSDMRATKAEALDAWAAARGRSLVRFDYAGHGESEGRFADFTISDWLADAEAVIGRHAAERPVLVGSSMGGWIALLAARRVRPAGLVLIAPAVDFTEELMWARFPEEVRAQVMRDGVWQRGSAYSPEPTPVTRALIEDGRRHCLLGAPIDPGCPVHILQGMADPDVPWRHALRIVERLPGHGVILTLIKDGDHRLSGPADLDRLVAAVEGVAPPAMAPPAP